MMELTPDEPGRRTSVGFEFLPGLPIEDWILIGQHLAQIDRSYRWWVGDWLNYGEREYGETYGLALKWTDLDYQSLANCKWVAAQVEFSRRRENLSWSHHLEVAGLEPSHQDHWLARAEHEHWTREELRAHIKGPKALPDASAPHALPLLRFCQPDLPTPVIVSLILRVAFPDARTALDMTYGSGAFWDGSAHVHVTAHDADPARALDGVVDFTALPYDDGRFDVALFDPPHLADAGAESIMGRRFGTYRQAELPAVIEAGTREAWRVARLGIIVKIAEHVHGQEFVAERDWVRGALADQPLYDIVHQTRTGALVDPRWEDQLSAYNNGSSYLVFRRDGPKHVRRKVSLAG